MKILLVEDNERVSQFVVKGLQEAGHTTDHAANGRDGMFLAASEPYDVIIMDRMLPGDIDGLAIIEVLRKAGKRTPILILSALSEVDDRIRGLRSGGDDYLTKPFAFGELLARLDALHRRAQGVNAETPLTVGDLHMDPLTRKVTRGSRPIALQPREFKLLEYLMRHAGQVVTRTMLLENVWDYHFDPQTNVVDVHISKLRQKIDAEFERPLLRTVRNAGYTVTAVTSMMRSSAVSLALGYVALGITALVLFAAPLWYAWQVTIQEGRTEILQVDAQRLAEVFRRDGADGVRSFIDTRVRMQIAGERILLLTDASLHPLSGNLPAWPADVPTAPGNYTVRIELGDHGTQTALVHVATLGSYNLLVGRDNALFAPLQTRFWYGLAAAIAVLSIAGLLIGLITRRALMSRVHSIRQTVSAIIHGDLQHRLPTHLSDDELNTLSRTINGMLEQIELLVHGVRNVSNSIAHDLRTPLAELRSRLEELALIRPAPEETFAEIDGAVADVDRVIRIFDALLRLAEIDAGLRRSGFVSLDVADLAANAVEFYAPAAELKNIDLKFHSDGTLSVSGDPVLLAQALSNLIDNALKYAPVNGTIEVAVLKSDGKVEVSVSDNGPGIVDAEKSKVMERFYRGDASRGTPGVGLGLSLAQAVAKLHGSVLDLTDQNPGLRVAFTLPPYLDAAATAPHAPPLQESAGAAAATLVSS